MDDLVAWLNQNQGAVMALLTLVYVLFTGALLLEARSGRVEKVTASVEAYPMLYEMMHMYLTGRLENGGPAIARDVEWTVSLRGPEKSLGEPRRYAQALMGAGKHRTMLLDPREGGQATTLNQMAEDGVVARQAQRLGGLVGGQ